MDKVVMERIDAIVNNLDPEIRELAKISSIIRN